MIAPDEKLLALIAREKTLAEEFLRLTRRQAQLLEREEMTAFGKSLEERQKVIEAIQRVREELSAITGGAELPKAANEGHEAVLSLLRSGQAENEKNEKLLKTMMDKLSGMIRNLDSSKRGLGGYGAQVFEDSGLFDKKF